MDTKHNEHQTWIAEETRKYEDKKMNPVTFSEKDIRDTVSTLANWRAPGLDGVHNFWFKKFSSLHEYMATCFNNILQKPETMPKFMARGYTYLLPKNENYDDPSMYRPITCLPTLYKIFSAIISNKIYTYLEENNILTPEQKGCRKRARGCKEQAAIDAVVLEQSRKKNRNLNMAYIDYQKAFDSVPHTWLMHVLKIYGINENISTFLKHAMTQWHTKLVIRSSAGTVETENIKIRRGIFQGDSLSALWFCIALNPLSNAIKETGHGYKLKASTVTATVSHLFYMDDLKIYASNNTQLQDILKVVHSISQDIGMTFGLSKCQIVNVHKGKVVNAPEVELDGMIISAMATNGDPYKYLGFLQTNKMEHKKMKQTLTNQFHARLKAVLRTKLNSKNLVKAINSYVIPILAYSFGIIACSKTDLEELIRNVRVQLTKHRMHHPRASKHRFMLPRHLGGRGILNIHNVCATEIKNLRTYFHNHTENLHRAIVNTDDNYTPLNLKSTTIQPEYQNVKDELKNWAQKELHGRFYNDLQREEVNRADSLY